MQSLRNVFNRAAAPIRTTLNKNMERISSACYIAGDVLLFGKEGLNYNLETLSGALFIAGAAALWKGANPIYMKLAGYATIAGAAVLGAAGYGQPGALEQGLSAIPTMTAGYLMTRDSATQAIDDVKESAKGLFNKVSGFIKEHPLILSGGLTVSSTSLLMSAAVKQDDMILGTIAGLWTLAAICIAGSDPSIKKAIAPKQTDSDAPSQNLG
ncbi:MAG: hypothetical protein NZ828_00060 [Alphaproteobacteria bacterium]|nr:hypothetical protein [Alphaproteobacteria bacterium]MCS5595624.1 hypothetical protein [Alphaproteobacteria bacterium]|tara:strand:+ start:2608 stop:3243 length:636 start_codon:yes stop_codon:yes gene_type:complete